MDYILTEFLRVSILMILPIVVVGCLSGMGMQVLLKITKLEESSLVFSVKLVSIILASVVFFPSVLENLKSLLVICLKQITF